MEPHMGMIGDYRRLMRAGIALARHDVILPGAYQTRLPLPARIAGRVLRLVGGGTKGRPGQRLARALEKLAERGFGTGSSYQRSPVSHARRPANPQRAEGRYSAE